MFVPVFLSERQHLVRPIGVTVATPPRNPRSGPGDRSGRGSSGGAGHLRANAVAALEPRLALRKDGHARLPTFRATYSPS